MYQKNNKTMYEIQYFTKVTLVLYMTFLVDEISITFLGLWFLCQEEIRQISWSIQDDNC